MKKLESVDRRQLIWKQPHFGARYFELWSGDDLMGTLDWPKLLSDRAFAKSGDGQWYLDRKGFFRRHVVAVETQSGMPVASFEFGWFGDGTLNLTTGREFRWYRTKAFRSYWALADETGAVLLEVRGGMRWFKHEADVVLHPRAASLPEVPLLIFAAWYLAFMTIQDSAGAVAATTAATS